MATDFFQRQSEARRSTSWLVTMFLLAVIAIVSSVAGLAYVVLLAQIREPGYRDDSSFLYAPLLAAAATLLLIVTGTIYKVLELRRGGGTVVAERLGGRRVYPNVNDPDQRRLLNVVEEMAIASGTPVPPVFLLDDTSINAFAAGYSPSDAVLGVTRGCAQKLTREQLQGVIAHEFSHVLNGDMRMNIRLIGILHGILLLGLAGQMVLRSVFYSGHRHRRSSNRDKGGGMLVVLGIAIGLIAIGFIGTFFGNLIKAAVSRQREYLADASAVQFTRNPEGLAGALKRIGGAAGGSRVGSANAAEASHMFFSSALRQGLIGLWATHPPLAKRILAIDPSWDGTFPAHAPSPASAPIIRTGTAGLVGGPATVPAGEVPVGVVDDAVHHVGEPTTAHQHYAVTLLRAMPQPILEAARDPYGARAIVFCLLLDRREAIRAEQLKTLQANAAKDVVLLAQKCLPAIDAMDVRARLPLVDLALPSLRAMSESQYKTFARCFIRLVDADKQINLFEWTLAQILMRHLRPQFEPVRSPRIHYYGLQKLADPCSVLLSTLAYAGNKDDEAARAFSDGAKQLPAVAVSLRSRKESTLPKLVAALKVLVQVAAKHRGRLVDACAAVICADQHVTWQEAELLRGISDLLDCPMPPLLVDGDEGA